jgi:hypothetical protein
MLPEPPRLAAPAPAVAVHSLGDTMTPCWTARSAALVAIALLLGTSPGQAQSVRLPSEQTGSEIPGKMPGTPQAWGDGSGDIGVQIAASGSPASGRIVPNAPNLVRDTRWPPAVQPSTAPDTCSKPMTGRGTTYNVGPGQKYDDLNDVPWLSLQAGDVVNVFYRPEPYRSKIGLRGQGTADAPIVINGVTDAACQRPVISGENAQTVRDARQRRFFNKQYSENLGVFLVYKGPDDPYGYRPKHLQFKNLKITGGHQDFAYTAQDGTQSRYSRAAAAIYAVVVEDLLVEQCEITGNGNGIFVNSKSGDEASYGATFRFNRIHDNGVKNSWFEHNLYVQTQRSLYEGNYIGQLIPGAAGSSLKDRSSATVVRYNHIVAAARALDLVEIEGGVPQVLNDPYYPSAWVYGNLIVDAAKNGGRAFSVKLIHWGGDNDPRYFRPGTLWFYNNTVVLKIDKSDFYYVSLFDMPTDQQKVNLRANVIQNLGSAVLYLGYEKGTIDLDDTNLISGGYQTGRGDVKINVIGSVLDSRQAGLDSDGRPLRAAPGTDRGKLTPLRMPAGISTDDLEPHHQFAAPARIVPRPVSGAAPDLGAFELSP